MKPFTRLDTFVRPLIITVVMGCLIQALVQTGELLLPTWDGTYLTVIATLAAFVASLSYVAARRRFMSGTDLLGYNLVELGLFMLALRIGRYAGHWEQLPPDARAWSAQPLDFLDFELILGFAFTLVSWLTATQIAQDFRDIVDPAEIVDPHAPRPRPLERLATRLAVGGLVLVTVTGINRIGLAALKQLDRPRVSGLIGSVLLYFSLSLVLLAQGQYEMRRRDWEGRELPLPPQLARRWTLSSLGFLGLAALLAFLIPTGQTLPLLELVRIGLAYLAGLLSFLIGILSFLLALILLPLTKLLKLGNGAAPEAPEPVFPTFEPPPTLVEPVTSASYPWLQTLRSVAFWALLIGGAVYLVHSYVQDRGGWGALAQATRSLGWLRAWWLSLLRWWRGVQHDLQARAEARREARRQRAEQGGGPQFRQFGRSPRERIMFYYLSLLYRAAEIGFSRRRDQTPYEYQPRLQTRLPEAADDIALLTERFVAARYGDTEPTAEQERAAKAAWQRLKLQLARLEEETGRAERP